MIEVLLSERIRKTADKLPPELRDQASQAISKVAAAFGDPHQHRGLGLRKLAKRSSETPWRPKRSVRDILADTHTWVGENESALKNL